MKDAQVTNQIIFVGNVIVDIIKADLAGDVFTLPADVDFNKLYSLCDMHRVTPLVAETVIKSEYAPAEIKAKFKKELFKVSMRYESQMREKNELSAIFSEHGIKHCFLKGEKISKYYKVPEHRFMLDMDVYVDVQRIEDAQEILIDRGYTLNSYGDDKDIGFIKKPFFNVEIHKELKYDYDKGYEYYKGAFSRLSGENGSCELNMTNEDFYVYILSHCAHHFATAGTGIRNVLDHYYLNKYLRPLCDVEMLSDNLAQTGLSVFSAKMDKLSDCWFGNSQFDDDTQEMADYIILSGVFGNESNHYLGGILRGDYSESKSSFFIARVFPPISKLRDRYPVLKKMPLLLPFVWVVRIVSALFNKKDFSEEMKTADSVSQQEKDTFRKFIEKNGL